MTDQIIVQYAVDGFGSDDDLARRHRIEQLLDEAFQSAGLGECEGGDIGSGTMNIFVVVSDVERGKELLLRTLREHGELRDAVVAISTPQGDDDLSPPQVVWPEGYTGEFSIL